MVMFNDPEDKYRELSSWRELLGPYLQAMRDAGLRVELPPLHTDVEREDLWFSMQVPSHSAGWKLIVKGMEWLDLVARVDRDCAWRLLFELSGRHAAGMLPLYGEKLWNTYGGPVFPQYELKILCGSDTYRYDTDLDNLSYLVKNERTEDPRERSLKSMLLSRVNAAFPDGRTLDRSIDGYVKLRLSMKIQRFDSHDVKDMISAVECLAESLDDPSDSKFSGIYPFQKEEREVFQCHSYRIKFRDGPLTDDVIQALQSLTCAGTPLTHIVVPAMGISPQQPDFVEYILKATTNLTVGRLDDDGVRTFFSQLAIKKGRLPAMEFNPGYPDLDNERAVAPANLARPDLYWPWLAYALFSCKVIHEAEAVKICIRGLTVEHVEMMQTVLLHNDPLELLTNSAAGAMTFWEGSSQRWPRPELPTLWRHTIRHLSISSWWTLGVEFFTLLELIGGPISRLSLSEIGDSPGHLLLDAVFLHCPNLRQLDLDSLFIESLDWFTYRYRPCHKLETLCLGGVGGVGVQDHELGSWVGLFSTLSDPVHPLTMTLSELHICFRQVAMAMLRADQVVTYNALVRMLDHNENLTRVEVAQCPLWMADAFKHRVQAFPKHRVAPAIARRVCGFYPCRRDQSDGLY